MQIKQQDRVIQTIQKVTYWFTWVTNINENQMSSSLDYENESDNTSDENEIDHQVLSGTFGEKNRQNQNEH